MIERRRPRVATALVVATLFSSAAIAAEPAAEPRGEIAGTVTDELGSQLPGVAVTLQGAVARAAATDASGRFRFGDLPAGQYALTTSFAGFRSLRVPDLVVEAGLRRTVNLVYGSEDLALDDLPESVIVAPEVETAPLLTPSVIGTRLVRVLGLELTLPVDWEVPATGVDDEDPSSDRVEILPRVVPDAEPIDPDEDLRIVLGRIDPIRLEALRPLLRDEYLRTLDQRTFYQLPGYPGPFGAHLLYLLVPLADGSWLEVITPKRDEDGRASPTVQLVGDLILSLREPVPARTD